jgi:flagellar motor switch protein FliN/FliY
MTMLDPQADIDAVLAEAESLAHEAAGHLDTQGDVGESYEEDAATAQLDRAVAGEAGKEPLKRILAIRVPVIVRLAKRNMRLSEVLHLSAGSIVEFDRPFDAELDLMVNNQVIGTGQAVKAGEKFGLRIVNIRTVREKINALAEQDG